MTPQGMGAQQKRDDERQGQIRDDGVHGLVLLLELEADGGALQGEGLAHAVLKVALVVVVHDIGAIHEEGEVRRAGAGLGEVLMRNTALPFDTVCPSRGYRRAQVFKRAVGMVRL